MSVEMRWGYKDEEDQGQNCHAQLRACHEEEGDPEVQEPELSMSAEKRKLQGGGSQIWRKTQEE